MNGAKYRTEIEGYSDITYKIKNARAYLEVRTRDGRVLEYGSTMIHLLKRFNQGLFFFGCYLK